MKMTHVSAAAGKHSSPAGVVMLVWILAAAVLGLGMSTRVAAQSTHGAIAGHAPAGDQILIKGVTGLERTITVRSNGRYAARGLPVGVYTVTLVRDGQPMATRRNVGFSPGGSHRVNFECDNGECTAATGARRN